MNGLPVRTSGVLGALAVGASLLAAKAQLGEERPALGSIAPVASGSAAPLGTTPTTTATTTAAASGAAPVAPTATVPAAAAPVAAPAATGPLTIPGDLINTEFGDLQVAVVLDGGRLVDVLHLATPEADQESIEINRTAMPELHRQVIEAQGSDIQGVSGATYTAQAYAMSVQSALDRA